MTKLHAADHAMVVMAGQVIDGSAAAHGEGGLPTGHRRSDLSDEPVRRCCLRVVRLSRAAVLERAAAGPATMIVARLGNNATRRGIYQSRGFDRATVFCTH